MKKIILILALIFCAHYVSGQSDTIKPKDILNILNEYSISVNRTILNNGNTADGYGFGLGIYHTFMPQKRFNIKTGVEFNMTSQFKKQMYEAHYFNSSDITINIYCLSIPVEVRFNIGKKVKWFIAFGSYLDLANVGSRKGTITESHPADSTFTTTTKDFTDYFQSQALNVGISCGTGLKIPISKHELIIKPDIKWGFRNLNVESYSIDRVFNRYIRLMIGFRY